MTPEEARAELERREALRELRRRQLADTTFGHPQESDTPRWEQLPGNIGPSADRAVDDIMRAIEDPMAMLEGAYNVGKGGLQKIVPGQDDGLFENTEGSFDRAVDFLADRYGGLDEAKRTLITDPVGTALDATLLAPAVAGAVNRIPQIAGKIDRGVDAAAAAAGGVAAETLGLTSGGGAAAVKEGYKGGRHPGNLGRTFEQNMRGKTDLNAMVRESREALKGQYIENAREFVAGRAETLGKVGDQAIDWPAIEAKLDASLNIKLFKDTNLSKSTGRLREKLAQDIEMWSARAAKDPDFGTLDGLDKFRELLGEYVQKAKPGSAERAQALRAYHVVKQEIVSKVPEYAEVLKNFAKKRGHLDDMEKALSLGPGASTETALRKLQAIMRNDVTSAYGKRGQYADDLTAAGAVNLKPAMSGQALSSWKPRGLSPYAVTGGGAAAGGALIHPSLAGLLAAGSPRMVGEAALAAGKGARATTPLAPWMAAAAQGLFQQGRAIRENQ